MIEVKPMTPELRTAIARLYQVFGRYFAAIANVYPDFQTLLQLWEKAAWPAQHRLATDVYNNAERIRDKQRLSGFKEAPEPGQLFHRWATTDASLARLKAAFFSAPASEAAQRLFIGIQSIENK